MLPSACGLGQHFQDLGHSFSRYGPPSRQITYISFEQKEILDKNLTRSELFEALRSFKNNKTPGNDGLTAEFYLAFWPLLEKQLVESLQFFHVPGQLSSSQKQALIILLEKKDKDRRFIKNWRPISLINVDVKIVSKAMAKRLEPFLSEIIQYNQNGFVKGRSVFHAVRTIDEILEFAEVVNRSGILVAIDFEKAFDSLNHNFLFKELVRKIQFWTVFHVVDKNVLYGYIKLCYK